MPPYRTLLVSCVVALGCDSQAVSDQRQPNSLSVAATLGLSSFVVDDSASGSTAAAMKLIYDDIDAHISETKQQGRTVLLRLRPRAAHTAEVLAEAFRYRTLESAHAISDTTIEVRFSDEDSAAQVATLSYGGFALGPFTLAQQGKDAAHLRRRAAHPIQEISIQEISTQDEWRWFLGRKLDVVPVASVLYRERLSQMPSVKIVDYSPRHRRGLLFNTSSPAFVDRSNRRRIAALLDHRAMARTLFGNPALAVDQVQPASSETASERVPLSSLAPLELAYLAQDILASRTAAVIRFQLGEGGVQVNLVPLGINELMQFCLDGHFDLTLLPIPTELRGYTRFLGSDNPVSTNITGYASEEYDAAFEAGDTTTMDSLLRRDVPVSLLYTEAYFAAMDTSLCLGAEPDPSTWRWLADIHPCNTGAP